MELVKGADLDKEIEITWTITDAETGEKTILKRLPFFSNEKMLFSSKEPKETRLN